MKKVWIEPGCISCGSCETICSDVFVVRDIASIKPGADFKSNAELIKEAVEICPVSVIAYEE